MIEVERIFYSELNESRAYGAECNRNVAIRMRVADAIRPLVNAYDL